ncbi:hypothetical protein BJX70DRAFT_363340 [Aspergillus crustosus]
MCVCMYVCVYVCVCVCMCVCMYVCVCVCEREANCHHSATTTSNQLISYHATKRLSQHHDSLPDIPSPQPESSLRYFKKNKKGWGHSGLNQGPYDAVTRSGTSVVRSPN